MSRSNAKLLLRAGVLVLACGLMAGCSASAKGQDTESAERHLRSLSGVESAKVAITKNTSGMTITNSNRALIILEMRPSARLTDADLAFILQTGWSLRASRELAAGVSVGIEGNSVIDLGRMLEKDGWVEDGQPLPEKNLANVSSRLLEDRFGDWPAEAPPYSRRMPSTIGDSEQTRTVGENRG